MEPPVRHNFEIWQSKRYEGRRRSTGSIEATKSDWAVAPFDPTLNAHGQILGLPMELTEMVGSFLDFRDLRNLREAHSQLNAYLEPSFFEIAQFHVIIDQAYLEEFRMLANVVTALKVKHIKLANRRLTETYWHEKHYGPHGPKTTTQRKMTCRTAAFFESLIIPSDFIIDAFASELRKFTNIDSITTCDLLAQVTHTEFAWGVHSSHASVSHVSTGRWFAAFVCDSGPCTSYSACTYRGVVFCAAMVLISLARNFGSFSFAKVKRLGLVIQDWPLSSENPWSELANFVFQCPNVEDLRMRYDAHGFVPDREEFRSSTFIRRIADVGHGRTLTKLASIDFEDKADETLSADIDLETALIQAHSKTLRHYRNRADTSDCSRVAHQKFFLSILDAPQLEKLDLSGLGWKWLPLSRRNVRLLVGSLLHFFDEYWQGCHLPHTSVHDLVDGEVELDIKAALTNLEKELGVKDHWASLEDDILNGGGAFDDLWELEKLRTEQGREHVLAYSGFCADQPEMWFELSSTADEYLSAIESESVEHRIIAKPVFNGDLDRYELEAKMYKLYTDRVVRWFRTPVPEGPAVLPGDE